MELAKITTRGQLTLPIEIRRKLKVGEGDKVVFYEENGKIMEENAAKLAFARVREAFDGEGPRLLGRIAPLGSSRPFIYGKTGQYSV